MSITVDFWTDKMIEIDPDWSWPKWCLQIYEQDLTVYPVNFDRNILALSQTINGDDDYLKYFKASRGYSRPLGCYPNVWCLMQQGDAVLYNPDYFVHLINQTHVGYPEDQELIKYIEFLCSTPTHQWTNAIANKASEINNVTNNNRLNSSQIGDSINVSGEGKSVSFINTVVSEHIDQASYNDDNNDSCETGDNNDSDSDNDNNNDSDNE